MTLLVVYSIRKQKTVHTFPNIIIIFNKFKIHGHFIINCLKLQSQLKIYALYISKIYN